MAANILKEFLIKLGFKIDDTQLKNFQTGIDSTIKKVEQIGKVAIVAGTALAGTTLELTKMGEELFFAAQQGQTSVKNLEAIQFAAKNVGSSAEEVTGILQTMASSLRTSLAGHFTFGLLGLKESADDAENLINIVNRLKQFAPKPGHFSQQYASLTTLIAGNLGVPEDFLNKALKNPNFESDIRKQLEIQKKTGLEADKYAKDSHEAMMNFRTLTENVNALSQVFTDKLIPAEEEVIAKLQAMVDKMDSLSVATSGWSTVLAGIGTILGGTVIGGLALKTIFNLIRGGGAAAGAEAAGGTVAGGAAAGITLGGIASVAGGIGFAALAQKAAESLVGKDKSQNPVDFGYELGQRTRKYLSNVFGSAEKVSTDINISGITSLAAFISSMEGKRLNTYTDISGHPTIGYGHLIQPGEDFSKGITDAQAMQLFKADIAKAQGAIYRLIKTKLNSNQLSALTDFVFNEGPGALLAKLSSGNTIAGLLNSGSFSGAADAMLKFNKARVNGALTFNQDLMNRRLGDRALFNKPVANVTQNNQVTVNGTDTPRETAQEIGKEQKRQNADLLRNMQGAFQ